MRKYPTEKQVFNQILKETKARGFGLLLAYTGLGAIKPDEPSWAEVVLVGENYNTFLLHINPKSIPHFGDPMLYLEFIKGKRRQRLIKKIRAEQQKAIESGRFVYVAKERIGLREVREAIRQYLPHLFPQLLGTKLYLLNVNKLDSAAEYWSEIEEVVQKKHGQNLDEFLQTYKPIYNTFY